MKRNVDLKESNKKEGFRFRKKLPNSHSLAGEIKRHNQGHTWLIGGCVGQEPRISDLQLIGPSYNREGDSGHVEIMPVKLNRTVTAVVPL